MLCGAAEARTVDLYATETVHRWASPEQFSSDETVWVHVFRNGKELHQRFIHNGCGANYADARLVVQVRVCGPSAPVRVKYVAFTGDVRFRLRYSTSG